MPLRHLANISRSLPSSASAPAATRIPMLASVMTHPTAAHARAFTAGAHRAGTAHGHESPYDPPSGWLFGVRPGEKYQNEGWERIFVWGFWGTIAITAVAYAYKPDSSFVSAASVGAFRIIPGSCNYAYYSRIQTWALEEARRRLEAEGIIPEPATAGDPPRSK